MRDRATVLDVRGFTAAQAEPVARWCEAHPPGRVYAGDWCLGTEHVGRQEAQALSFAWALRAECWRIGTDCQVGWGVRPDVLSPRTNRGGTAQALTTVAESPISLEVAIDAWPEDWRVALKGNLDSAWYSDAVHKRPNATAYAYAHEREQRLEIVGLVADITSEQYREWAIGTAAADLAALSADFAIVGLKPWLRAGSDYLAPGRYEGSNLIQPPPFPAPVWAHATSELLVDLADAIDVVTMVRPGEYALRPERIGLGGTAVDRVLGEFHLGVLA